MSVKYLIDRTTNALVFTGKPKLLSLMVADRNKVTSVWIPNSVNSIGEQAFYNCQYLVSVHIHNSVARTNWLSFGHCSSLASVHIPNSVLYMGSACFQDCKALTFIHFPYSISHINTGTFYQCTALASVYIPNSVSTIDEMALNKCIRLHKVCVIPNSKSVHTGEYPSFEPRTAILRPRFKPVTSLQKKAACRVAKASYSIYL